MSEGQQREPVSMQPNGTHIDAAASGHPTHAAEPHAGHAIGRLNWLRATVLGANDGIVSVAGIVVGVAGASAHRGPIFTAGLAAIVAGAVSMALGEFVSVSSQRDSESAQLKTERHELRQMPDAELAELTAIYQSRGLSAQTAAQVARELTAHDPLAAHASAELKMTLRTSLTLGRRQPHRRPPSPQGRCYRCWRFSSPRLRGEFP